MHIEYHVPGFYIGKPYDYNEYICSASLDKVVICKILFEAFSFIYKQALYFMPQYPVMYWIILYPDKNGGGKKLGYISASEYFSVERFITQPSYCLWAQTCKVLFVKCVRRNDPAGM